MHVVHWAESAPSVGVPQIDARQLWLIAILCFGVGDVVTTSIGLYLVGLVEMQPLVSHLFEYSILGTMVTAKSTVFASCYVLWKRTPQPYRVGVPLGLATLGTLVTIWNIHVLLLAIIR